MHQLRTYIRKILQEAEEIEITDIPRWIAVREDNRWGIYKKFDYGHRQWQGAMMDDGRVVWPEGNRYIDKHKPEFINKPIKAARYIFLKTQKPKESETLQEGYTSTPMKELGYTLTSGMNGTDIRETDNSKIIGHLDTVQNRLYYDSNPDWDYPSWEHIIPFTKGPKQAARYIWLKSQQTNEQITSEQTTTDESENYYFGKDNKIGDEYEFKELGYIAIFKATEHRELYWNIAEYESKSGLYYQIGQLWFSGDLEILSPDNKEWKTKKGFGTNLKNATKYIWLKRQKVH